MKQYIILPDITCDLSKEIRIYYHNADALGSYINNSENKIENLNMLLKYKDNGINMPFTIDERIIKGTLENPELIEQHNQLQQSNTKVRRLVKPSTHSQAFISGGFLLLIISTISVLLAIFLLTL